MVLGIGLAGLALGLPRQQSICQARQSLAQTRLREAELQTRLAAAEAELEGLQRRLQTQREARQQAQAEVLQREQALMVQNPEARWSLPPATLPEWNPESPYVWLPKSFLAHLPITLFTDLGELRRDIAGVLCLDSAAQSRLNARLTQVLADYHDLELRHAERTEDHLPGGEGQKLSFRINPLGDEASGLKQQFESALRETLGQQRADLLLERTGGWFDSSRNQIATEPKTITVVRHADGTYNLALKCGNSWTSHGGRLKLEYLIPAHLLPLFQEIIEEKQP